MPDGFSVEVEGVPELKRALEDVAHDLDDPRVAMSAISVEMSRLAAQLAPRLSGTLAGSIHPTPSRRTAAASTSLVYAGPINGGWPARNIAPSLFMERAQAASEPVAVKHLEQQIDVSIRREGLA